MKDSHCHEEADVFLSYHSAGFYQTHPFTVCTLEFLQFKPLTFLRITSSAWGPLSLECSFSVKGYAFLENEKAIEWTWGSFAVLTTHINLVSPLSISEGSISYLAIDKEKQKYFNYRISNNVLLKNSLAQNEKKYMEN